jgi:NADPH:quinone reductase-like Zn-dependent oxidoreductase
VRQLALPPGATLLVTGVGGGVGVAAAQVAAGLGLTVVGSAAEDKRAFVEELGVRFVASGPGLAESAALLEDRTKLMSGAGRDAVAALGGAPVGPVRDPAILGAVVELVRTGALDPKVMHVIPFERAPQAVRAVEGGHGRGETVLEMPR